MDTKILEKRKENQAKEEGLKAAIFAVLRREDHAGLFFGRRGKCPRSATGEHCWHPAKESYVSGKEFSYGHEFNVYDQMDVEKCCHCGETKE